MAQEIITGDGRIFKETGRGTFKELGGKKAEVSPSQIKQYEKYTGVKVESLKDSARSNPNFTEMMWNKAKHS